MDEHGSKPEIDKWVEITVPVQWAVRPQQLRDGRWTSTCGGCSIPHYCAARGRCHRAVRYGELPPDGIGAQ